MFRHEYRYLTLYQLHRVARVKLFPDAARMREGYLTPLADELINDNDPVLVQFIGDEPLVPIWELARDPRRRDALEAAVRDIASRIGAVINGDRDIIVDGQIKCLDASDAGAGELELSGRIDLSILDGDGNAVWEAKMFDRDEDHLIKLKTDQVHECPQKRATIEGAADASDYSMRFRTKFTELDDSSSDDDLGEQVVDCKFVDGRLLGDHVHESKLGLLEFKFTVSLEDID